jgi:cob(I)alamin adenosyltransferase
MMADSGCIHIYTGTGKGKTTAAVGLATRALGHGMKVCYVSFHKRPEIYGYSEIRCLKDLGAKVLVRAKGHPHMDKTVDAALLKQEVVEALEEIKRIISLEEVDLLVLDEILISVRDKFIEEQDVIEFIRHTPEHMELVLTGRGATEKLMELAHYITNMDKVKHPFDHGKDSRKGIEF